jgi:hypothetical protein
MILGKGPKDKEEREHVKNNRIEEKRDRDTRAPLSFIYLYYRTSSSRSREDTQQTSKTSSTETATNLSKPFCWRHQRRTTVRID